MLKVENLEKNFGGIQAVRGCSFEVEAGRITGLIGPNGAGKTTIFNMIAGAERPSAGRIIFEGEDIAGLPTHSLFHRGILRTFQIPHEFGKLTVLENLMVVPPGQSGESLVHCWLSAGTVARQEAEVRARAEEVLEFLSLAPSAQPAGPEPVGRPEEAAGAGADDDGRIHAWCCWTSRVRGSIQRFLGKLADMIRRLNHRARLHASASSSTTWILIGEPLRSGHRDGRRRPCSRQGTMADRPAATRGFWTPISAAGRRPLERRHGRARAGYRIAGGYGEAEILHGVLAARWRPARSSPSSAPTAPASRPR